MQCVASNPVLTVDYTGPIAVSGYATGTVEGSFTAIWGEASDDKMSFTIDIGVADLDPRYTEWAGNYYWGISLVIDNCDTSYTWGDSFFEVSYVDDEQNTIDVSALEDAAYIRDPDTGICREYGSRDGANSSIVECNCLSCMHSVR